MEVATTVTKIGPHEVMLWLHTAQSPTLEEWDEHIAKLRDAKKRRGGDMTGFRSFVLSDGAAPSVRERKIIFSEVFSQPAPFAAVSVELSNPLMRGVATVIAWLQPGFKAYQPDAVADAIAYIGLKGHTEKLIAEFDALQRPLSRVRTLDLVKRALGRQSTQERSAPSQR